MKIHRKKEEIAMALMDLQKEFVEELEKLIYSNVMLNKKEKYKELLEDIKILYSKYKSN